MESRDHLYLLWTHSNPVTAEKMVFMYTVNSLKKGWWEKVTVIVWGDPARLVAEDAAMRETVMKAISAGVHLVACKACADQLGVTETLEALGIEVIYTGELLTRLLKTGETVLTV